MTAKKYILSQEQIRFLELVDKLHHDKNCTFSCAYPLFVKSVLTQGAYRDTYASYLNGIAAWYIKWRDTKPVAGGTP